MDALALPDLPPRERFQHDEIEQIETIAAGVKSHRVVDQIQRLVRRRRLGDGQEECEAHETVAERYYGLVRTAGFEPRPQSPGWQRVDNGGGGNEVAHHAAGLVQQADEAMGETQASAVRAVVVEGWSPGGWAYRHGYTRPEIGLAFLVDGLRLLRRHWGM